MKRNEIKIDSNKVSLSVNFDPMLFALSGEEVKRTYEQAACKVLVQASRDIDPEGWRQLPEKCGIDDLYKELNEHWKMVGCEGRPRFEPLNHHYHKMSSAAYSVLGHEVRTINWMPVTVSRLQLSEGVIVSDEFREDFNRWAHNLFGIRFLIYKSGHTIYCHPEVAINLRAGIIKEHPAEISHAI